MEDVVASECVVVDVYDLGSKLICLAISCKCEVVDVHTLGHKSLWL